jgi:hypothetical protein
MGDIRRLVGLWYKPSRTRVKVKTGRRQRPGQGTGGRRRGGVVRGGFVPATPTTGMDQDRLSRFLRAKLRAAGEQYGEAAEAYRRAKNAAAVDLPVDDDGRAKLVCRRHAERRAVAVNTEGRPSCYDAGHPDCEGCVEDIEDGYVETW